MSLTTQSTQSAYNSLALHEILLSIADSLNEAQQQLRSMPPYDEYGRPNTLYQLPYLDFNLEVISQFESQQTAQSDLILLQEESGVSNLGGAIPIPTRPVAQRASATRAIRFTPFRSTETVSKNLGSITSTISGRFVAVMPNEGLPQIFLSCTTQYIASEGSEVEYKITVRALQPDNQPIVGQRIEVNFDAATSLGINSEEEVSTPVFMGAKDGYTNPSGEFSVTVRLDLSNYNSNKTFVFVANSGTQSSSIAISKP
ncbi:hypothetical protein D3C87_233070 [compost metagenome]